MQNPVCNVSHWLIAVVLASATACSVDKSGLGQPADASVGLGGRSQAGGRGGGQGGPVGIGGASGLAGGAGLSGVAGDSGIAGVSGVAGVPGVGGVVGTGGLPGAAGTTGAAGNGPAGAGVGGSVGAGGTGGTVASGEAGRGGSAGGIGGVTAAGGAGGRAGRGGFSGFGRGGAGATCDNNNDCPACFRCAPKGCEPIPDASWTVICRRATIAPTKPNGAAWDAMSGTSALPDVFCELKVDSRSRSTSIDGDSLTPEWNDNVTPLGGELTSALLMSPENRWSVTITDQDNSMSSAETICSVTPRVTGADLLSGELTFSDVDSCTELVIGFTCAD
jgi:hypothetical protein